MTDAELWRKATTTVREIQQMRAGGFSLTGSEMDREAYARRLLELLPPEDDGEVVTRAWLAACGFKSVPSSTGPEYDDDMEKDRLSLWDFNGEYWVISSLDHFKLTTRGHVRRLCAALGVTLQEPKQ